MNKERLHQLLRAVGSRPQTDDSLIECTEFNWNEPHYFSVDQLSKLDTFALNLALALSEKFSSFCRSSYEAKIVSVSQQYAERFLKENLAGQNNSYYLPFSCGQEKEFGTLEISNQTAISWAKQLLGDFDSNESQDRELSQLEESLLCDLATTLVGAFTTVNPAMEVNPSDSLIFGRFPFNIQESEEICRISFTVNKPDSEFKTNASFFIPCKKMEMITGRNKYSQDESSGQDFSKLILEHINTMPICITVQLAVSQFSFEEMMDLQVNDIIKLDKGIDEPVDLIINGRTFACGLPAKSEGNYAINITDTEF